MVLHFISLISKLIFSGQKNPARQQIGNKSFKTLMRHLIQISKQMLNLIELGNYTTFTQLLIRRKFILFWLDLSIFYLTETPESSKQKLGL